METWHVGVWSPRSGLTEGSLSGCTPGPAPQPGAGQGHLEVSLLEGSRTLVARHSHRITCGCSNLPSSWDQS